MVKAFPPCKAAYPGHEGCKKIDADNCEKIEADADYNMSGIDWVGPSSIMVVAEIPCSSSRGGIMCQVMGYELQVPTGRILKRIDAKHLKLEWQKSMAWNFQIPDPPRYCAEAF